MKIGIINSFDNDIELLNKIGSCTKVFGDLSKSELSSMLVDPDSVPYLKCLLLKIVDDLDNYDALLINNQVKVDAELKALYSYVISRFITNKFSTPDLTLELTNRISRHVIFTNPDQESEDLLIKSIIIAYNVKSNLESDNPLNERSDQPVIFSGTIDDATERILVGAGELPVWSFDEEYPIEITQTSVVVMKSTNDVDAMIILGSLGVIEFCTKPYVIGDQSLELSNLASILVLNAEDFDEEPEKVTEETKESVSKKTDE